MVQVRENLTGREFGRLKVIEQAEDYVRPDGRHEAQWLCECNCEEHNRVIVNGFCLKSGKTQSCGCLCRERTSIANKKYNNYDLNREYGVGLTNNTGSEFYFDLEDYDKIKNHCWTETSSCGTHRLVTYINGKNILMHQLLGFTGYDHINRNGLDNRKANFRLCTKQENTTNRSLMSTNTSGIIGVRWNKRINKWIAQIMVNYKGMYLGCFSDKEDAIKARLQAEAKYFGEFAPQLHLFKKYNIQTEQND